MVASYLASFAAASLFEIDEMQAQENPDGTMTVVFVTTGVHPSLAKIKTLVWALFGLPIQSPEDVTIEELQGGVLKRYKITVRLKPALKKLKRGEGLGIIPVLTGENVNVVTKSTID